MEQLLLRALHPGDAAMSRAYWFRMILGAFSVIGGAASIDRGDYATGILFVVGGLFSALGQRR